MTAETPPVRQDNRRRFASRPAHERSAAQAAALSGSVLNLHLHHLAYLLAVERTGGVTRAAEAVHMSQPALSQALAELERRLGVALLERAGRGRRLTTAGREVAAYAHQVLSGAADLQQRLAGLVDGRGGILRVGMIDAAPIYLLPEAIRTYRATYPEVDLRITVETSSELLRRLRAAEIDLAFAVNAAEEPDLTAVRVAHERLYWYAPAGDPREPHQAGWALYPAGSRTRRQIDVGLARAGIQARVTLESANPEVLRQMAVLELGWTVLPPAVAERDGGNGLRRGGLIAERTIDAATRRSAPADARVACFLALVEASAPG